MERFTDSGSRSILEGVLPISVDLRDKLLCNLGARIQARRDEKQNSKKDAKAHARGESSAVRKDSDDSVPAKPSTTKQSTLSDIFGKAAAKSKNKEEWLQNDNKYLNHISWVSLKREIID